MSNCANECRGMTSTRACFHSSRCYWSATVGKVTCGWLVTAYRFCLSPRISCFWSTRRYVVSCATTVSPRLMQAEESFIEAAVPLNLLHLQPYSVVGTAVDSRAIGYPTTPPHTSVSTTGCAAGAMPHQRLTRSSTHHPTRGPSCEGVVPLVAPRRTTFDTDF